MAKSESRPINQQPEDDVEQRQPQDAQPDKPVTATGPATAPASQPEPAKAVPATGLTQAAKPKPAFANAVDPHIPFETDGAKLFPNYDAKDAAELIRSVPCYVAESFNGVTRVRGGRFQSYAFAKHSVIMLPKWFALQHPTRLVIKE